MEHLPNPIPLEDLKDNETLLYFTTLMDDDRIDVFFENGERRADFNFICTSTLAIHRELLPKNHINNDDTQVTAFSARGHFTLNDEQPAFHVTLSSTQGQTPRSILIESDSDDNIYLYERNSTYFTGLGLKEFGDLTLRVGNTHPDKARRDLNLKNHEPVFDNMLDIYNYWGELACERSGVLTTSAVACQTISQSEAESVEVRLAQKEKELPRKSVRELIIEHATQMHALDAEIVHRLELRYESTTNHEQEMLAEKRVISGCERQLVNARLTSTDRHGRITPLDINDDALMKQFQTLVELALQST